LNPAAIDGTVDILMKLYQPMSTATPTWSDQSPILTPRARSTRSTQRSRSTIRGRFRHPEWDEFVGLEKTDAREFEAAEKGLQYVGLEARSGDRDGSGLAMGDVRHRATRSGTGPRTSSTSAGGASAQVIGERARGDQQRSVGAVDLHQHSSVATPKGRGRREGSLQAVVTVEIASADRIRLDGTNAGRGPGDPCPGYESERLVSKPTMVEAARTAVEWRRAQS